MENCVIVTPHLSLWIGIQDIGRQGCQAEGTETREKATPKQEMLSGVVALPERVDSVGFC